MLVTVHSVSSVCLRLNQISHLPFMQYMGLCIFRLPFSLMMIVRIRECHPVIIKSEVRPIGHCLGLGHETMVCALSFHILVYLHSFINFLVQFEGVTHYNIPMNGNVVITCIRNGVYSLVLASLMVYYILTSTGTNNCQWCDIFMFIKLKLKYVYIIYTSK